MLANTQPHLPLTAPQIHDIDGEQRMRDIDIAEALGFERPRKIRDIIARKFKTLEGYGKVCTNVVRTSAKGGRPAKVYYLNLSQAVYICTQSETARALEITKLVIDAFVAAHPRMTDLQNNTLTMSQIESMAKGARDARNTGKFEAMLGFIQVYVNMPGLTDGQRDLVAELKQAMEKM